MRSGPIALAAAIAIIIAAALIPSPPAADEAAGGRLVVFAAASLKNALDGIKAAYEAETGKAVVVSYEASGTLARQIEAGAPADIFVSADRRWMDHLSGLGLTDKRSEVPLLGNRLVLIAPAGSGLEARLAPGFDLAALIGSGRLAMGDLRSVPAGAYGKAALESLGLWRSVEPKVAQAANVRAALKLVAAGEARLGIVYASDVVAEPEVEAVGTFPTGSHPPIVYPAARIAGRGDPDADSFLRYLRSSTAGRLFRAQGFDVLGPPELN